MKIKVTPYSIPKQGSRPHENEDAYWPRRAVISELGRFRCAIADGASQSSFSRIWARQLVRSFAAGDFEFAAKEPFRLDKIQEKWPQIVLRETRLIYKRESDPDVSELLEQGAYAAFSGLQIQVLPSSSESYEWVLSAIGDTCLAHIRDDVPIRFFPIVSSKDFENSPPMICSLPGGNPGLSKDSKSIGGTLIPKDILLLMSDALAKWFLELVEAGGNPWPDLFSHCGNPSGFQGFIDRLRNERKIRNDDTSLICIEAF